MAAPTHLIQTCRLFRHLNVQPTFSFCLTRWKSNKLHRRKAALPQRSDGMIANSRLMKKFIDKRRKNAVWHNSPASLIPSRANDSPLATLSAQKRSSMAVKRADNVSQILYRNITQMVASGEVDARLVDLDVHITKVRIVPDFSSVNVTWVATGSELDAEIADILEIRASRLRNLLIASQLGTNVPRINFVKDKTAALAFEVDKLLLIADKGEEDDHEINVSVTADEDDATSAPGVELRQNILGLDHTAIMAKILCGPKQDLGGVNFDPSVGSSPMFTSLKAKKSMKMRYSPGLVYGDATSWVEENFRADMNERFTDIEYEND